MKTVLVQVERVALHVGLSLAQLRLKCDTANSPQVANSIARPLACHNVVHQDGIEFWYCKAQPLVLCGGIFSLSAS